VVEERRRHLLGGRLLVEERRHLLGGRLLVEERRHLLRGRQPLPGPLPEIPVLLRHRQSLNPMRVVAPPPALRPRRTPTIRLTSVSPDSS
jgi:hypothetical protein